MKEEDYKNRTATIQFDYFEEGIKEVPVKMRFLSGEVLTKLSKYDIEYQKVIKNTIKEQKELKESDIFKDIDIEFIFSLKDKKDLTFADSEKAATEYEKLDEEKLAIIMNNQNKQKELNYEYSIKYFLIITYPINPTDKHLWHNDSLNQWKNHADLEEVTGVNSFFRALYK